MKINIKELESTTISKLKNIIKTNGKMEELNKNILKIGALSSGRGISFEAIIQATKTGLLKDKAAIEVLICDKAKAHCMRIAKRHEIPSILIESNKQKGCREEFDKKMIEILDRFECELIVLVGYMRLVSKMFINHFNGNVLNFHPSLLPSFKGMHAVTDALAYGVKVSGATIHFVDPEVDHGPIIIQKGVTVYKDDSWMTLGPRILSCGCEIFPKAVELFCDIKLQLVGRTVKILE